MFIKVIPYRYYLDVHVRNILLQNLGLQSYNWRGKEQSGKSFEHDERSLAFDEIDLSKVKLINPLRSDEKCITHEDGLRRLKQAAFIHLDYRFFKAICDNTNFISDRWQNYPIIYFFGTIIRFSDDSRNVPYIIWRGESWESGHEQIDYIVFNGNQAVAVLEIY